MTSPRLAKGLGRIAIAAASGLAILLFACRHEAIHRAGLDGMLRVGVLPDQRVERTTARYEPLLDHLAEALGVELRLVVPESYEDLLGLFERHEIDLAHFGGVTFVLANLSHDAVPLAMRDSDLRFTSYILVGGKSSAETLQDLKGEPFAFGSRLSTSGHFMPRLFLAELDITPEEHFGSVSYTGKHDATFQLIKEGRVGAGAANAQVVEDLYRSGAATPEEVRILWESPPFVDYVWAVQHDVEQTTVTLLRDAFLDLQFADPEHRLVLDALGAEYFLPADMAHFEQLSQEVRRSYLAPETGE